MVRFPPGHLLERLGRVHARKAFSSGQPAVDEWLKKSALQNQEKNLSVTNVLVDAAKSLAGYYTLAMGQVDFGELPEAVAKKLPQRMLPIAVIAWLGVASSRQGEGLGRALLAQALHDCHEAGQTFPFIAVVLDCVDKKAKSFYERFDFIEFPEQPYRLFLTSRQLELMMQA